MTWSFYLNIKDMRKNAGVAQILLPGFDLQDISLPKDSAKKEAMLKMYSDAMKTALAGITSIDDIDIDDEDDPTFTDDIMEKIERFNEVKGELEELCEKLGIENEELTVLRNKIQEE